MRIRTAAAIPALLAAAIVQAATVTPTIPEGWVRFAGGGPDSLPTGCEHGIDKAFADSGLTNMTVRCDGPVGMFGGINQGFSADDFRGKRVRFSALVRTENIVDVPAGAFATTAPTARSPRDTEGFGALWIRVAHNNPALPALVIDNMRDRPIKGTVEWLPAQIVVDIPEDAGRIHVGFFMQGRGQIWVSNIKFEVVDQSVPVTATSAPRGASPSNLDLN